MITVKTTAHVDDKREVKVQLQLPENLAPGEYELLIVLDEKSIEKKTKKPLKFANYDYQVAEGETFRREDIYGEDGR